MKQCKLIVYDDYVDAYRELLAHLKANGVIIDYDIRPWKWGSQGYEDRLFTIIYKEVI